MPMAMPYAAYRKNHAYSILVHLTWNSTLNCILSWLMIKTINGPTSANYDVNGNSIWQTIKATHIEKW